MQELTQNLNFANKLQEIDLTAHKIGAILKSAAKFLFAFLVYFFIDIVFAVLLNCPKSFVIEFVKLLNSGSNIMLSQNVLLSENLVFLLSFVSNYKLIAISLAFVVTAISFIVTISNDTNVVRAFTSEKRKVATSTQSVVSYVGAISYKQHVAFLA